MPRGGRDGPLTTPHNSLTVAAQKDSRDRNSEANPVDNIAAKCCSYRDALPPAR
jgi:hypothetical protein